MYDVIDSYQNDSGADFHQTVADMAEIPRTQAKTINLGLFYGMGKAKLQAELGVSKDKAKNYLIRITQRYLSLNNLWTKHLTEHRIEDRLELYLEDYVGFIYGNQTVSVCTKR